MNIVYASNDLYVKHLAASMYSLFDNNREADQISVYIFSVKISDENIEKLHVLANKFDRELNICDLSDIKERFSFRINTRGFDISALSRLFIAGILPKEVKRVIYLDCDTIIAGSIKELWNQDLNSCSVGAVIEPTVPFKIKQQIDMTRDDVYFNSGVLVIDIEQWRVNGTEQRLLDYYESKGGQLFACDQDTINGALKGQIYALSPKFNFFTNYKYFRYNQLLKELPAYKSVPKEEFKEAKRNPVIIHFLGDERPWKKGNFNPYRDYYERYMALTCWKDIPKEGGMEFYLLCYHMMNLLTPVVPYLRKGINRLVGMKVIDARSKKKNK